MIKWAVNGPNNHLKITLWAIVYIPVLKIIIMFNGKVGHKGPQLPHIDRPKSNICLAMVANTL